MAEEERNLIPRDEAHERLMRSILKGISDTPLVLKGGTALLLAYDLSRFSEDLDFDAPHKLNLESRIQRSVPMGITLDEVTALKDTGTVTRYRAKYHTEHGPRSLKLEVSYRTPTPDAEVRSVHGIRVASLPRIIDQKLKAAHDGHDPRAKVRDLYDLDFAARRWPAAFTGDLASRLQAFAEDPGVLESRYQADYDEDDLIPDLVELEDLALRMHYAAQEVAASRAEINQRVEGLPALRGATDPVVCAFWKHADEAVASMKAGGGSAYEVDWRQVEDKAIREGLERGQSLGSIADALGSNSPGAASPGQQAALRERIAEIGAEKPRADQQGLAKLPALHLGNRHAYKQAMTPATVPAWSAEQEHRAAGLEGIKAMATGALLTFAEIGAEAIKKAGEASRVDWRQVEDAAISKSLKDDRQPADDVYRAIVSASPGALTDQQQAALRERIDSAARAAQSMEHVAQRALETLVDGYLSTGQVLAHAHDALAAGQFVAGLDGLGQLDAWEETSGLLKRQFYVAGQEDGEAAVLRNAYFGQFEGHAGYQLLISDEQDREIAMVPVAVEGLDVDHGPQGGMP